jgi:hypothetical protein
MAVPDMIPLRTRLGGVNDALGQEDTGGPIHVAPHSWWTPLYFGVHMVSTVEEKGE